MRRTALILLLTCSTAAAGEKWRTLTKDHGLPGNEVQLLKEVEKGEVWVGTLSGLAVYRDGKVSVRLPKASVWDVCKAAGGYWIGTSNGAVLLKGGQTMRHLKGTTVSPVIPMGKGAVWAISKHRGTERNTLMEGRGDAWAPVARFRKERVNDLTRTSDGTVWVSVAGNGLYAIDPAKGADKATRHLEGKNVTAVAADPKKRLWCGTWGQGVYVRDDGKWTQHLGREKSAIFGIVADTKGTIWVATSASGLWRYDGEAWTNDLKDEGAINMLAATSDGRVWISSQATGGLRYWDGKAWQVSLASPLPIRCMLETSGKQIFAGGVLDGLHVKQ